MEEVCTPSSTGEKLDAEVALYTSAGGIIAKQETGVSVSIVTQHLIQNQLGVGTPEANTATLLTYSFVAAGTLAIGDSVQLQLPNYVADGTLTITSFSCGGTSFTVNKDTNGVTFQLGTAALPNGTSCSITTSGWQTPAVPEIANATSRTVRLVSSVWYNALAPVKITSTPAITAVQTFSRTDGETVVLWDTLKISSLQADVSCYTIDGTTPLCNGAACVHGTSFSGADTTITIYKNHSVHSRGCVQGIESRVYSIHFPYVICAAGMYSDTGYSLEANDCKVCANGTYLGDGGTNAIFHDDETDCEKCELGKTLLDLEISSFQHDSANDCITCPEGRYADELGSSVCSNCSVGTYLIDKGTIAQLHSIACQCQ